MPKFFSWKILQKIQIWQNFGNVLSQWMTPWKQNMLIQSRKKIGCRISSLFIPMHRLIPLNSSFVMNYGNKKIVKKQSRRLDYLITENEIRTAVKKLKNIKSPFLDKIKNKKWLTPVLMICCPYNTNLLMQLFIRAPCLRPGVVVSFHRFINQVRGRSNPSNYRGICVSSCLGKLFCSILYQRLLERVVSRNILLKSQISFLPIKLYSTPYFYTTNFDRQTRS